MFKVNSLALAAASAALALALSGCGAPSDEEAVRAAVEAEVGPIATLDEPFVEAAAAAMGGDLDAYGVEPAEFVEAYLEGFSFEVVAVEVDGDAATAEVTLVCKSVVEYASALQGASTQLAQGGSLSGADGEAVADAVGEVVLGAWDEVKPTECRPVVVLLERGAGGWAVSAESEEAILAALLNH